jgi:hypothetical protein
MNLKNRPKWHKCTELISFMLPCVCNAVQVTHPILPLFKPQTSASGSRHVSSPLNKIRVAVWMHRAVVTWPHSLNLHRRPRWLSWESHCSPDYTEQLPKQEVLERTNLPTFLALFKNVICIKTSVCPNITSVGISVPILKHPQIQNNVSNKRIVGSSWFLLYSISIA